MVVISTLVNNPQGSDPVPHGVPASASKTKDPLAVPPSLKVTPVSVQVIGPAVAASARANKITIVREKITALLLRRLFDVPALETRPR